MFCIVVMWRRFNRIPPHEVIFLKILVNRVDHFLVAWLLECSLHEMWSSSKAAKKVFLKILLKRVNHFLKEQLPECSVHALKADANSSTNYICGTCGTLSKNLTKESKPLFEGATGMLSRRFCTCALTLHQYDLNRFSTSSADLIMYSKRNGTDWERITEGLK